MADNMTEKLIFNGSKCIQQYNLIILIKKDKAVLSLSHSENITNGVINGITTVTVSDGTKKYVLIIFFCI